MAGDSPSESVASQVRAARKLSPDGTKAIYDLTSGVDFSKPKRTARAIAQVLWEEDVQSWWTWRGAGPAFHPTRKVELRLPSGHDRKVEGRQGVQQVLRKGRVRTRREPDGPSGRFPRPRADHDSAPRTSP